MSKLLKLNQSHSTTFTKKEPLLAPIKILQRYTPTVTEFNSVREFQQYLAEHKEEMDSMTTQKLNKTFRITDQDGTDGGQQRIRHYCITKLKGEISLKHCTSMTTQASDDNDLSERVDLLEQQFAAIMQVLEQYVLPKE